MVEKDESKLHASRRMSATTFLMIGLIISTGTLFVFTPALNQNHTAVAQQQLSSIQSSNAPVQEDEEAANLKFASQAVKQSSNNSVTAANIQLPEATKGHPIPVKGYLVQQIKDGLYWLTDGA